MWFLFRLVLILVSRAEPVQGPVVCTASWQPPPIQQDKKPDPDHPECALQGAWQVSAAGPKEKKTEIKALDRLDEVLNATFEARLARVAGSLAEAVAIPQRDLCLVQMAKQKQVQCRREPSLTAQRYCFVKFDAPECWAGMGFEYDGLAVWKATEKGTERMCEQVEQGLVSRGVALAERLECHARCLQEVQVQCADL